MPPTDAHDRQAPPPRPKSRPKRDAHDRQPAPKAPVKSPSRIIADLERRGSVHIPPSQAARILPALKKDIERRFPGRRVTYERSRLVVHEPAKTQAAGFLPGDAAIISGLRKIPGDVAELGSGAAGMLADYGSAVVRDVADPDVWKGRERPFRRTSRLAARDVLGTVGMFETLIPEPAFLPEWMRREVLSVDPEKLSIKRGSGRIDPTDVSRAKEFVAENPLITGLAVLPFASAAARRASVGSLRRSLREANPDLPAREINRIARKESKMPGYAAAHGIEGGIEPRILGGEYAQAAARPWSRTPMGRAAQRSYDRISENIEAKAPGRKFSTSQRAARMQERKGRKQHQVAEAEIGRLEREIRKAVGLFGHRRSDKEALIAALEGPREMTPRQAVELKLADLRDTAGPGWGSATESARAAERLRPQIAALERALADDRLESPEFGDALAALETLSQKADEQFQFLYPDVTDEYLANRRNLLVRRYANRGLVEEGAEARGYFPHRDRFEDQYRGAGAPAYGATTKTVGTVRKGAAATRKENRLRRYEKGRVQADPAVLSNTVRQRERLIANLEARRELYDMGDDIAEGGLIDFPEGMVAVRNPDASPTTLEPHIRAAIENPERYANEVGGFPEAETLRQWFDEWVYRGEGPRPEWLEDVANVRLVPEGVVRTRLRDAFPSAPRGVIGAFFGTLNSLARGVTIYLPYGGSRYVGRNTPQNMILLALTNPTAFRNLVTSTARLRRSHPALYQRIKVEAGTAPAGAGLPDLPGRSRNLAQKVERGTTKASRGIANALSEVSDEPWRVAAWIEYMRKADFDTPEQWAKVLDSDDAALVRFRDDIAQRVREDMIDFDSLSPVEREAISRYLFIYPFVKGSAKWPLMFLREYPTRAAILALIAAQHSREGQLGSVWDQGKVMIAGKLRDLGWLDPTAPARGSIEGVGEVAAAVPEGPSAVLGEASQFLAPQYREPLRPYGSWQGSLKAFVPFYSTAEKIGKGGDVGDQVLRALGVETPPPRSVKEVDERRENLRKDLAKLGAEELIEDPALEMAFKRQALLAKTLEGIDSDRERALAALDLAKRVAKVPASEYREYKAFLQRSSDYESELFLGRLSDHVFGGLAISRARSSVNDALRQKGLEPTR